MAHVPDVNDFVGGMEPLLAPHGVVTIEVPHLLRLVGENQFDTIYHEHFSYFSFLTACELLSAHGLEVFDVDELKSHGGSLRLYAQRRSSGRRPVGPKVEALLERERALGFDTLEGHAGFSPRVEETKWKPARVPDRGAGARASASPATAHRARATRCSTTAASAPICSTSRSTAIPTSRASTCPGRTSRSSHPRRSSRPGPDYILILPWNLKEEIAAQLSYTREWGARCVVPIPEVHRKVVIFCGGSSDARGVACAKIEASEMTTPSQRLGGPTPSAVTPTR